MFYTVVVFHPAGEATYTSKGIGDTSALIDLIYSGLGGSITEKNNLLRDFEDCAEDTDKVLYLHRAEIVPDHSIMIESGPAPGLTER